MSGNYPPGTGPGDPNAPWNQPEPPTCPDCGNPIGREGAEAKRDHAEDCPQVDDDSYLDVQDLREREAEPSRTWDDVKEDPTPSEAEKYGLEDRLQESHERDPSTDEDE